MTFITFKRLFFGILLGATSNLQAQELIGSSGNDGTSSTHHISWSVGEVATETYSATTYRFTQGLHQPTLTITAYRDELKEDAIQLKVFPNPASNQVQLISEKFGDGFQYRLTNTSGTLLQIGELDRSTIIIPLESYQASTYYLQVITPDKKQKVFKITKQ